MADSIPRAIEWIGGPDGCIRLIDQTRLPETLTYIEARDVETVIEAIRRLRVRGAPAIGTAAAMGFVLGAREFVGTDRGAFFAHLDRVGERLASARPTAVNLVWALDRMRSVAESLKSAPVTQ
ncbi:MAG: S-methyl-5-thioribose-1-phosphate isomerase, partial [Planctomycetota bacterium]